MILAIDPGKNGGLAFLDGKQIELTKMPATEGDLMDYLLDVAQNVPDTIVYLEQVGGFVAGKEGRQPGSAMFNFGRNYGFILGACAAFRLRVELVTPQKWQKAFPVGSSKGEARKRALKAAAQRLFPSTKGITLSTCDALLIAEWARTKTT